MSFLANISVSIIICTRNRAEALRQTLAALASVEVPERTTAEVLVVDNDSSDNTRVVVAGCCLPQFTVCCISQPEHGLSRARNAALAEAKGDILLFTDDDIRPPTDWIEAMTRPIRCGDAEAVAGGVKFAPHLERPWMQNPHRDYLAGTGRLDADRPDRMVGASMAFSRTVLEKIPGFDPELGAGALGLGEETLFSAQMRQAGLRIRGALDSAVEHHFEESRLSRASFLASAEKFGRSSAYAKYHWEHFNPTLPRLRLVKHQLELTLWRLTHWPEWHTMEGMPVQEMELMEDVALYRQYLIERRRPRNYDKYGLVKKSPEGTP